MSVGDQPIILKRIKKGGGAGHHGGAWKVAYADFVTAMMAFFLLMWLINTTSPEQKRGIADYFAPASVSETTVGSGGILGGTALGDDGAKANGSMSVIEELAPDSRHPDDGKDAGRSTKSETDSATNEALRDAAGQKREEAASPRPPSRCARRCRTCRNWRSSPRTSSSTRPPRACASS
jgi:chemotaxis protein MotB